MTLDEYRVLSERLSRAEAIVKRNDHLETLLSTLNAKEPTTESLQPLVRAIINGSEVLYSLNSQRERLVAALRDCLQTEIDLNLKDLANL